MNTYKTRAYSAASATALLASTQINRREPTATDVQIEILFCGVCHSDLSMLNNDWGTSQYPVVLGHEAIGRVVEIGSAAKGIQVGQRVGIGWTAGSCMHCRPCKSGNQHLCAQAQPTIVGRYGAFASRVRSHWAWAVPIPESMPAAEAGPLLCGGITVFNPIVQFDVRPTHRVGVIGIGGLGHLAIRFLRAWGCEVTAFTSSADKGPEARAMGAHEVVNSRDSSALAAVAGRYDFILNTVNVSMDWAAYINALAPRGRLHIVGAVDQPIPVAAFPMLVGQKSLSGSPLGSPATVATMLDFAARHGVAPTCEYFPMSRVNDALARLRSGKARYRVVLTAG